MKKNGKVKHDWKALWQLLKESRIPWIWYIINLAVSMAVMTVYAKLPMVQGQIMAGEIQDAGTITTYVLVTIASSLIPRFAFAAISSVIEA